MLSTRFTGSSTSMIVVSMRSAASTAVSAPGRPKCSATNAVGASSSTSQSGVQQLAHRRPAAVEEDPRVRLDGVRRAATPASGGYQS